MFFFLMTGTGDELELKQAAIPIVSLEQCRKWHKDFDVAPTMICAGHADGGHDSCDVSEMNESTMEINGLIRYKVKTCQTKI